MSCFNIFVKGHVHCAQRCLSDIEVGRKKLQCSRTPEYCILQRLCTVLVSFIITNFSTKRWTLLLWTDFTPNIRFPQSEDVYLWKLLVSFCRTGYSISRRGEQGYYQLLWQMSTKTSTTSLHVQWTPTATISYKYIADILHQILVGQFNQNK